MVACPDLHVYERMWLGQLSALEMERLSEHLEKCPQCVAAVQTLQSQDTFLDALRSHVAPAPKAETAAAEGVIARLKVLPGAAAAAADESAGSHTGLTGGETEGPAGGFAPPALDFLAPAQGPEDLGRLGSYRVLRLVGQGGMGLVFEAEDVLLERRVAVKVVHPRLAQERNARERFLREARAAAALKHEHVVTIFQVGLEKSAPYLVMEFLAGESLADRLKRQPALQAAEIVRIGREIAAGLAVAHNKGLIHRDIKPSNVWLEAPDGRVRILDFGLARPVAADVRLTQSGAILGTPAYMAPEQASGESVDARADLFSLGCVLYQMSTGRPPFAGASVMAILQKLAVENPRPPAEVNPGLPAPLSDLIVRLLAKDRARRPASAREVVGELAALERSRLGEAASESTTLMPATAPGPVSSAPGTEAVPARPRPGSRRHRLWAAAAVLIALTPLAYLFGPGVIRITTNKGELVIRTDDRAVDVTVKQQGKEPMVLLVDRAGKRQIELRAGEYEVEVRERPDGLRFFTKKLTLSRGGQQIVNVQLELAAASEAKDPPILRPPPMAGPEKLPIDQGWFKLVAELPPEAQVQAVAAKLKERNPGFDGKVKHRVEQDAVTELGLQSDKIIDLSPVRALPKLSRLDCYFCKELADLSPLRGMPLTALYLRGTRVKDLAPLQDFPLKDLRVVEAQVSDLSPLRKMHLDVFWCDYNPIADFSPLQGLPLESLACNNTKITSLTDLRGMKLRRLECAHTKISDLSPLRGMSLVMLHCMGTQVSDLTPLKNMPLEFLDVRWAQVKDLSPLQGLRLTQLNCDFNPARDADILRSIKTLEKINYKPAAEFWREVEPKKPS